MRRLGPPLWSFIGLAALATCVACRPKADANDPKLSETQAAQGTASSSAAAPSASSPLAKLEGDRSAVQDAAKEIAESGDEATKRAAGPILVKRIRAMREPAYREELRPLVQKANEQSQLAPTPEQLEGQLRQLQEEDVIGLVKRAGKIGGPLVTAYLVELVQDKEAPREVKQAALDALDPHRASLEPSAVAAVDSAKDALSKPPAGAVGVGGASVSGGTVSNAAAVVASMAAGFRRCFNRGLQDDPNMKGTVRVTAKIDKNGDVLGATPSASGTLSENVVNCVVARVSSAKFSPPEGGAAVIVIPVSMTAE